MQHSIRFVRFSSAFDSTSLPPLLLTYRRLGTCYFGNRVRCAIQMNEEYGVVELARLSSGGSRVCMKKKRKDEEEKIRVF